MKSTLMNKFGRIAQLGEHLPYKQEVIGSSPITPTKFIYEYSIQICAGIAQLVEQLICNQQVGGSSPSASSILGRSARVAKGGGL